MNTPIFDFVSDYAKDSPLRMHMPGHKGSPILGAEPLDITEIDGADSLYHAAGIIRTSEENASSIFGCHTFYSAEGSSLCIRTMLHLCVLYAKSTNREPYIAAARNVHTSFLSAVSLLDLPVHWLYPECSDTYLSCKITPAQLEQWLDRTKNLPVALYITSPDYLGNTADIGELARICHNYDVMLMVDNAHGAYLHFLSTPSHPIDLGADLCCDSAHKTLPVLTGGAYLHISPDAPSLFCAQAKRSMALFASTSPSYLILQSLDLANVYLEEHYREKLLNFLPQIDNLKQRLKKSGYQCIGNEPLKLTIDCKHYGYTGQQIAEYLKQKQIIPEFYDPDFLVLMLTPEIGADKLKYLETVLIQLPKLPQQDTVAPLPNAGTPLLSPRQASLSPGELLPIDQCLGRILAAPSVGCPPAVPIVVCGERIDKTAIDCFRYYGITHCCVVNE